MTKEQNVAVVKLQGSLDVSLQKELREVLVKITHASEKDLIIDFSSVTFIDSSCLGTLVSLAKNLRERRGDIKLTGLSDDVRSIFQITRLDRVFDIHDSNEEAIAGFYKPQ